MSSPMLRHGSWVLVAVSFALGSVGCDSPAPDLKEWTLADHKHRTERKTRREKDRVRNHSRPQKMDQVAGVTWTAQCASCHGKKGRADGPTSAMVGAKDLSDRRWQSDVTDKQIEESIRKGKGKMPAFNLPESTVQLMVRYVRNLRMKTREERIQERKARRAERKSAAAPVSGHLPTPAQPNGAAPAGASGVSSRALPNPAATTPTPK